MNSFQEFFSLKNIAITVAVVVLYLFFARRRK